MKKLLLILLCFPFLVFSQNEKRLALVIGNANYDKGELKNPVNDALLVTETLKKLEFDVILDTNIANKRSFKEKIREFGNRRPAYDVAFVYYAGHGIQVGSENYLLPTKEVFESEYDVQDYGVSVQDIMRYLTGMSNQVNILILDACRDNPFEGNWNATRSLKGSGLAKIPPPTGSLIAFSTDAGMTAADGDGKNSVYCESLSKNLLKPNTEINQVFKNVRTDVHNSTNGRQSPVENTKLMGDEFYLISTDDSRTISECNALIETQDYDQALSCLNSIILDDSNNIDAYELRYRLYSALYSINQDEPSRFSAFQDLEQWIYLLEYSEEQWKPIIEKINFCFETEMADSVVSYSYGEIDCSCSSLQGLVVEGEGYYEFYEYYEKGLDSLIYFKDNYCNQDLDWFNIDTIKYSFNDNNFKELLKEEADIWLYKLYSNVKKLYNNSSLDKDSIIFAFRDSISSYQRDLCLTQLDLIAKGAYYISYSNYLSSFKAKTSRNCGNINQSTISNIDISIAIKPIPKSFFMKAKILSQPFIDDWTGKVLEVEKQNSLEKAQYLDRIKEAVKSCDEAINADSDFLDAYILKIQLLTMLNRYTDAVKLVNKTRKNIPSSNFKISEVELNLYESLRKKVIDSLLIVENGFHTDFSSRIPEAYSKAMEYAPSEEILLGLLERRAKFFTDIKDYSSAISDYQYYLTINKNDKKHFIRDNRIYFFLSEAYDDKNDIDKAIEYITSAITSSSEYQFKGGYSSWNTQYYKFRGELYEKKKMYERAIQDYSIFIDNSISLDGSSPLATKSGKGFAIMLGPREHGMTPLTDIIAVFENRASCFLALNKYDYALKDYIFIIDDIEEMWISCMRGNTMEELGLANYSFKNDDPFFKNIEVRFWELFPNRYLQYYRRANIYRSLQKYDLALNDYSKCYLYATVARGFIPSSSYNNYLAYEYKRIVLESIGNIYIDDLKDDQIANEYLTHIIDDSLLVGGSLFKTFYNRASIYNKTDEIKKAKDDYKITIKIGLEYYNDFFSAIDKEILNKAIVELNKLFIIENEYDSALIYIDKLILLDSNNNAQNYIEKAWIYESKIRAIKDTSVVNNILDSLVLEDLNKLAVKSLTLSLDLDSLSIALYLRGTKYFDLKRYEKAIDDLILVLENNLTLYRKDAYSYLSRAFMRLDQWEKACFYLEKACKEEKDCQQYNETRDLCN